MTAPLHNMQFALICKAFKMLYFYPSSRDNNNNTETASYLEKKIVVDKNEKVGMSYNHSFLIPILFQVEKGF